MRVMHHPHRRQARSAPFALRIPALAVPSAMSDAALQAHARADTRVADVQSPSLPRLPTWAVDQLAWPLLAFILANLLLIVLGGDRWIADHVYAAEGGRWALQDSYVTTTLIHVTGKRLSTLAWLLTAGAALLSWRVPRLRPLRRPLVLLAVSVLLSTAVISSLKHFTHMDCPWDMQPYGGLRPYLDLFDARPAGMKASGCFPAGHASAGYAWVALYFFALSVAPRWRWRGLWCGLGVGLLFGLSQQLRGAHFMSHDVWTVTVCWLAAVLVHRVPWRSWRRRTHTSRLAEQPPRMPPTGDTPMQATAAEHPAW